MSDDENMAHHGAPALTRYGLEIAQAVTLWIETARKSYGRDWLPSGADFEKSRLFWRIRSGKEPLEHAPPTCFSCPWYEVVEEPGPHSTFDGGLFKWDDKTPERLSIAQCPYNIIERSEGGRLFKVSFGPYVFYAWPGPTIWFGRDGPVARDDGGWYIQLAEHFKPENATRTAEQLLSIARTGRPP